MSDTVLPTASAARTRAFAATVLRPHRTKLVLALGLLAVGTVVGLAGPRLLGHIVDLVGGHQGASAITWPAGWLAVVAVGQAGLATLGAAVLAKVGQAALATTRELVLGKALRLPADRVERAGTGDLVSRVSGDSEAVSEAVADVLPTLLSAGLQIALTLVGLVLLDWRFALAALCAAPLQYFAVRWYLRTAVPVYAAQRLAEGTRAQQLVDSIGGAATVRALRLRRAHLGKVAETSGAARDLAVRTAVVQSRFFGKLNGGELIGLCAVLLVGFLLVRADAVTIGTASAAALYFHRLFDPFNSLLGLFDDAQAAMAAFARMVGVADLPDAPAPDRPATPVDRTVRVAGLSHSYVRGRPVLHDVTLDLLPGQRVAVVGESGAGKTTLAKLVAGLHLPSAGSVRYGGIPAAELAPGTVALVSQEVHVFAGPLAEDLRLADPAASDQQLLDALDLVGASAWVRALPSGVDTVVGAGGHRLTATQAQQVALARLALADPAVAVLDEATAEAGSAGARVLERAADAVLADRTALVVAHRLSQAAAADRVLVLDGGRVVEDGSHAELIARPGRYAELWSAWTAAR